MPETVVVGGDAGGEEGPETAAHEAARAEGATAVRAEQAELAAEEAKAAAEIALAAAEANIETATAVEGGVAASEQAAMQATVSAEMVHEALQAQSAAISAVMERLEEMDKRMAKSEKPDKPAPAVPESEPREGPRWVRR